MGLAEQLINTLNNMLKLNLYSKDKQFQYTIQREFITDLIEFLQLYYPINEIYKVLPEAINIIEENTIYLNTPASKFAKKILIFTKRFHEKNPVVNDKENILSKFKSSIKSTIALSILNNEGNSQLQDLFMSLDYKNLYRIALAIGGSKVRIPTVNELNQMFETIQNIIEHGTVYDKNAILKSLEYKDNNSEDDLFAFIQKQSKAVDELLDIVSNKLANNVDAYNADELLQLYNDSMKVFEKTRDFITTLRQLKNG